MGEAKRNKRVFKVFTGCKTYGITNLELGNICNDPECLSCSSFIKAFKEAIKNWETDNITNKRL